MKPDALVVDVSVLVRNNVIFPHIFDFPTNIISKFLIFGPLMLYTFRVCVYVNPFWFFHNWVKTFGGGCI